MSLLVTCASVEARDILRLLCLEDIQTQVAPFLQALDRCHVVRLRNICWGTSPACLVHRCKRFQTTYGSDQLRSQAWKVLHTKYTRYAVDVILQGQKRVITYCRGGAKGAAMQKEEIEAVLTKATAQEIQLKLKLELLL